MEMENQLLSHCVIISVSLLLIIGTGAQSLDYADALTKSLLYFEAQRSGRLPYNQRVTWRDHSGLTDGLEQGVRLANSKFYSLCLICIILQCM